jgi:Holliday junction resolvasome RuvABC DNA-binding subunit
MKKALVFIFCVIAGMSAFAQETVQAKLTALGAQNVQAVQNPTPKVKTLYRFTGSSGTGAVIVFALKGIKTDAFAVLTKTGDVWTIVSVEAVNPKAYGKGTMTKLNESFARWNGTKEAQIPDAVSQATKHSKDIYEDIRIAATEALGYLKK